MPASSTRPQTRSETKEIGMTAEQIIHTHEPAEIGNYIELGGIITRLEQEDPNRVLPIGFANPHSYRGYYCDLAFDPVRDITIGDMLTAARSALGATFEGWKGGDNLMTETTDCWISLRGESADNKIGPLLLELMLRP
jgi:hypothetical protein